jgi:hypothetical protein
MIMRQNEEHAYREAMELCAHMLSMSHEFRALAKQLSEKLPCGVMEELFSAEATENLERILRRSTELPMMLETQMDMLRQAEMFLTYQVLYGPEPDFEDE